MKLHQLKKGSILKTKLATKSIIFLLKDVKLHKDTNNVVWAITSVFQFDAQRINFKFYLGEADENVGKFWDMIA